MSIFKSLFGYCGKTKQLNESNLDGVKTSQSALRRPKKKKKDNETARSQILLASDYSTQYRDLSMPSLGNSDMKNTAKKMERIQSMANKISKEQNKDDQEELRSSTDIKMTLISKNPNNNKKDSYDPYGTLIFQSQLPNEVRQSQKDSVAREIKGSFDTKRMGTEFSQAQGVSLYTQAEETLDSTLAQPPIHQNFQDPNTANIVIDVWNKIGPINVKEINNNAKEVDWSDDLKFNVINNIGFIYQGQTRNGQKQGIGRQYNFMTGEFYEGQFVDDQISGYGRFVNPDGSYYKGMLEQGVAQGKGSRYDKDGTLVQESAV